jgi:hypothetical protein
MSRPSTSSANSKETDVDARNNKPGHDEGGFVPDRIFAVVVIEMERE